MAETGRAAVYVATGQPMEIREYPVPDPEPGAILIKVTRANICGSDLHYWRGDINLTALGAPLPAVIGHEMMGTVAKLGEGVVADSAGQPLAVGDRVVHRYFHPCGHCRACMKGQDQACPMAPLAVVLPVDDFPHFTGVYAEYYYARPNQTVFKVPDNVTDDMAAPANCALSQVIHGLERVNFSFGETIAIQGAGGLGLYATAVAKEMGAAKVIVIDGIDERLELAKAFGADELIDIRQVTTPTERWLKVRELTDGWGADVVAELVGFPQVIPEGIDMLGNGGRYLLIGNVNPMMTYEADPSQLVMNNKSVHGVLFYPATALKKALDFLSRAKDRYPFDKILSCSYPLEEINEAFTEQDKGHISRSTIIP
ncbi:MAG: zinc-binding dehydrogenase [Dehalococcoidia bacterium]|nr:MAG: zinc-binding dehydrogenase [Dehalococcoidia bacterium]UCG83703.1 MAG: zinc-binding dehydrogenase [Dehalococcoidia bacterium]